MLLIYSPAELSTVQAKVFTEIQEARNASLALAVYFNRIREEFTQNWDRVMEAESVFMTPFLVRTP